MKWIFTKQMYRRGGGIDIWGSCVSREIFNYSDRLKVGEYLLQQPLHTVFAKPYCIDESQIVASHNFVKRMALHDFNKDTKEFFLKNFNGRYLLVDVFDSSDSFYTLKDDLSVRIESSLTVCHTIESFVEEKRNLFIKKSFLDIPRPEWEVLAKEFCFLLKKKYKESHIIINSLTFAPYFNEENELVPDPKANFYSKRIAHCKYLESLLIKNMPKALVLPSIENPVGNPKHKLGANPVHFIDENYIEQAKKLEVLLNKSGKNTVFVQ